MRQGGGKLKSPPNTIVGGNEKETPKKYQHQRVHETKRRRQQILLWGEMKRRPPKKCKHRGVHETKRRQHHR